MQRSLLAQALQRLTSQLLRFALRLAAAGDAMVAVAATREQDEEGYKLPKILSKRFA